MRASLITAVVFTLTLALTPGARAECPGDVSGDGMVGFLDLTTLLAQWGECPGCSGDLDGSGSVGFGDLTMLLNDWGCVLTGPETMLSGFVVNTMTNAPISGATVTVGTSVATTGADGTYSGSFPSGLQTVVIAANNFFEQETTFVLLPNVTQTLNGSLAPVAPVVVTVTVSGDDSPGGTASATAIIDILDGSTLSGILWSQVNGADATLTGVTNQTVSVGLGSFGDYKTYLYEVLAEPPIGEDQLPPNVPLPEGEFPGGLQNRFELTALNPFVLEETGIVTLDVEVTTSSGTYEGEGEVHTGLPWKTTQGIRTTAMGIPVLLHGKDQASYNWTLDAPNNSNATLLDPTTKTPEFTPDIPGIYDVMVSDLDAAELITLRVYAGTWRGAITGQDEDGRPESDLTCVLCHENLGADQFTPWKQTGHAEIFSQNLDNSTYYRESCFACHTVGYDPEVDNGGFDDAGDYQAFLNSGLLGNPGDNWTTMLEDFPQAARRANAQCEVCHGPQWEQPGVTTPAHGPTNPAGEPRASLSSNVCGTCHGEPLRHARFQQWQLSGHANYELAIDESESGSCSRCHTANGFLTWLPVLDGDEPGDPLDDIEVTWTADESHPQTCVTCHDPHMSGTTSGNDTNATVRISGNTPPLIAGFTAFGVGRGAICMTCHNSRRGLRNEGTWPEYAGTSEAARAPHGSAQTDMLMGQNAYLIATGIRGGHSFATDTCVQCHMEQTPPPDDLAYNQSGSNHTFFARADICVDCHGASLDGEFIQNSAQETMNYLQGQIEVALFELIEQQTDLGNKIDLNGDATITDADDIMSIEFGESRGRQAMTVTFTDASVVGPVRMPDVDVLDAGDVVLGTLYDFADDSLPKAGWNWALVHNDGSLGIHNPTFAFTALEAGIAALGGSGPSAATAPVDWRPIVELGFGARQSIAPKKR